MRFGLFIQCIKQAWLEPSAHLSRLITPEGGGATHNWGVFTPFWGGEGGCVVNPVLEALLGNKTAASALLFLQCYGEGHAQRIANTFGFGLNMTQRQLKRLEELVFW
jgi:hypothetical protein